MNVEHTVKYCLCLPYPSLENYARINYKIVYDYLSKTQNKDTALKVVNGCIFTCVAVDGKLSNAEQEFICNIMSGYNKNEVFEIASEFYNKEAQDIVKKLINYLPNDVKEAYVKMCIAVLAVDKKISSLENTFLKNFI